MNVGAPQQPLSPSAGPADRNWTANASTIADPTQDSASSQPTSDHQHQTLIMVSGDLKSPRQASSPSPSSSLIANNHHHDNSNSSTTSASTQQHKIIKKNLKTEYKSNFTPFDQYVYNENTDSFVKQQHCKLSAGNSNNQLNLASSNQDLSSMDCKSMADPSPVLNVEAFEPLSDGNPANHSSEPWYKEVVRRNEKAHEYRFKSEVGHNSPLSKLVASDEDAVRRSPCGNDPLIEAQIREHQQEIQRSQLPSSAAANNKPPFRFSPNDYSKRDHMILHMANNNNFNLPKQGEVNSSSSSSAAAATRRTAGTRPPTRSAAQDRARSQSTRRPLATTGGAHTNSRAQPETKSNHTTPTKRLPSTTSGRTTTTATRTMTSHGPPRAAGTAGRPTTASASASRGPAASQVSSSTAARRPPTALTKTTPRTNGTTDRPVSSTNKTPLSGVSKPRVTSRASPSVGVASSTTKSPVKRPTTAAVGSTRQPLASSSASRPSNARSSVSGSISASRTKASPPTTKNSSASQSPTTTQVKSIKTPKALASAQEKAAAAAVAAAALATGAVIAAPDATSSTAAEPNNQLIPDDSATNNLNDELSAVNHNQAGELSATVMEANNQPDTTDNFLHEQTFGNSEANMLFATTKNEGNMLADEIAQAEKVASEAAVESRRNEDRPDLLESRTEAMAESQSDVVNDDLLASTGGRSDDVINDPQALMASSARSDDSAGQLFNGLKDGLLNTGDGFSSSERELSLENPRDHLVGDEQQVAGNTFEIEQQQQHGQNSDDEPYSIMPTTFDAHSQQAVDGDGFEHEAGIVKRETMPADDELARDFSGLAPSDLDTAKSVDSIDQTAEETVESNDIKSDSNIGIQESNLNRAAAEEPSDHGDKVSDVRRSSSIGLSSPSGNDDVLIVQHNEDKAIDIDEPADRNQVLELADDAADEQREADSSSSSAKSWDKMYQVQSDHKEALEDKSLDNEVKLNPEEESEQKEGSTSAFERVEIQRDSDADWPEEHQKQQQQVCHDDEVETKEFRQVFDENRAEEEEGKAMDGRESKSEKIQQFEESEVDLNNGAQIGEHLLEEQARQQDLEGFAAQKSDSSESEQQQLDREPAVDQQHQQRQDSEVLVGAGEDPVSSDEVDKRSASPSSSVVEARPAADKAVAEREVQQELTRSERSIVDSADDHDARAREAHEEANVVADQTIALNDDTQQQLANELADDSNLLVDFAQKSSRHTNEAADGDDESAASDSERHNESGRASELLMNVADLVDFEARKKQELVERSQLARQQSGSLAPSAQLNNEMLLSPDQLISALGGDVLADKAEVRNPSDMSAWDDRRASERRDESADHDTDGPLRRTDATDSRETITTTTNIEQTEIADTKGTTQQVDLGLDSETTRRPIAEASSALDLANQTEQHDDSDRSSVHETMNLGSAGSQRAAFSGQMEHLSNYDELDNDEHLKISNHLTNSDDDELIQEPRSSIDLDETLLSATTGSNNQTTNSDLVQSESTTNFGLVPTELSSPRYNEGAGLSNLLAAQDDDDDGDDQIRFEADTARAAEPLVAVPSETELFRGTVADSLNQAAAAATHASTTTSTMPDEIPSATAAAFIHTSKLVHKEEHSDDDDDELLDLNDATQVDRITDVAATMSPSSSVASELLRMNNKIAYSISLDNDDSSGRQEEPAKVNNNDLPATNGDAERPRKDSASASANNDQLTTTPDLMLGQS